MISFYFETCDFTNNANFIHFKWTLKRKHFTQLKFSEWRSVVIFHILQRNFPNVHMKIVLCSAKSLEFLFHYFILNWYILVHSLVKTLPKQIYFSFSILKWQIIVQMRKPLSKCFSQVPYQKAKQKQKAKCKECFAELKNI